MKRNSSGQALLIILLVMAVALTIGLSVVSRSITDIRISQEQEESARAFSAAEAGLESLLAGGDMPSIESFNIIPGEPIYLGDADHFIFPKEIRADNTQTVWLVDHVDEDTLGTDFYSGTDLEFYWGNKGLTGNDNTDPALEAVIIYESGGVYTTRRVAFDPKGGRSAGFTGATVGSHTLGGKTFSFKARFIDDRAFPTGNDLYALRIKLLYNAEPQILGVKAFGDNLPLQGTCYQVTAQSTTGTGIARKVEQCQFYPSLSGIFDYVLFSESSL